MQALKIDNDQIVRNAIDRMLVGAVPAAAAPEHRLIIASGNSRLSDALIFFAGKRSHAPSIKPRQKKVACASGLHKLRV